MDRCYNCGKELKDGEVTREHIPARSLFKGYDSIKKSNRITVPACLECNNKYSLTDEEFRNMIGVISNQEEHKTITDYSVRSIIRKDPDFSRLRIDFLNNVVGVEFNEKHIIDFHKKNFKGLFYYQYGSPLPDSYKLLVDIGKNDINKLASFAIEYLNNNFERKFSGHRDIFSYCIQPFRPGIEKKDKDDLEIEDNEKIIVGMLVYNKIHGALVYAIRKDLW